MTAPKLRFKEFKNDWLKTNLGEVVKFSNGKRVPLSESERQKRQGAYRYYGASGVIDYVDDYLFDGEYILIGEDGANIITRSSTLAFVVTGKFWVNNHAHIFQSKEGNNIFLATYLESLNFEKFNSGTAQPKLNLENLKKVPVANPTKEEQTKIATFLSTVDEKISQLSQKLHLLGQYKQGMMQKLFSQQIRFKADDGSEFGDWEEIALGKIKGVFIASGKSSHEKLEFAKYYYYGSTGVIGYSNEYDYQGTRILIARVGHNAGYIYMVSGQYNVSDNTLILELPSNLDYIFIRAFLEKFQLNKLVFGTGQPLITGGLLKKVVVQLPCIEEQTKIANFLSAIDQKIDVVSGQLEQAKLWKKGLLQQMFV